VGDDIEVLQTRAIAALRTADRLSTFQSWSSRKWWQLGWLLVLAVQYPWNGIVSFWPYFAVGILLSLLTRVAELRRRRAGLRSVLVGIPLTLSPVLARASGSPGGVPTRVMMRRSRGRGMALEVRLDGLETGLALRPRRAEGEGELQSGDRLFDGQLAAFGDPAVAARLLDARTREGLRAVLLRGDDRLQDGQLRATLRFELPDTGSAVLSELLTLAQGLWTDSRGGAQVSVARRAPFNAPQRKALLIFVGLPALVMGVSAFAAEFRAEVLPVLVFQAVLFALVMLAWRSRLMSEARDFDALEDAVVGMALDTASEGAARVEPEAAGTHRGRLVHLRLDDGCLQVRMKGATPGLRLKHGAGSATGDPKFDASWTAGGPPLRTLAVLDSDTRAALQGSVLARIRVEDGELSGQTAVVKLYRDEVWSALEEAAFLLEYLCAERFTTAEAVRAAVLQSAREDAEPGHRVRCLDALLRETPPDEAAEILTLAAAYGHRLHLAAVIGGHTAPDVGALRTMLAGEDLRPDERREARALMGELAPDSGGAFALTDPAAPDGALSMADGAGEGALSLKET